MNCPSCLSIMSCQTEIINVSDNLQRMDLHCYNKDCPSKTTSFLPHMGVFVRPNEIWSCYNYTFPLQYKNKWYSLHGIKSQRTQIKLIEEQSEWVDILGRGVIQVQSLRPTQPVISVDFISISTGDDMHLEANKLFTRLMNLVVFT